MSTHGIMIGQVARSPIVAPRGAAVGGSQIDRHIAANFYPTPPEATLALLSVESFDGSIWEPACGKGHIASVLKSHDLSVVSTDLNDWGFGVPKVDFLKEIRPRAKHIVTNPPYGSGLADDFMRSHQIDYFENGRRATLAHRAYAIENPSKFKDYGENIWGLSACDGPFDGTVTIDGRQRTFKSYTARGAAATYIADDGTITPTAAASSIVYAPEISIPAIEEMRKRYGDRLYSTYGFFDAFNPTLTVSGATVGNTDPERGWFDIDYLGIDQGPIVAMIENHRSNFVWNLMHKNPYIAEGLRRAGFTAGWLDAK